MLHGQQSAYTCCPHGVTTRGPDLETCGCRDDVTETPYRLAYTKSDTDGVVTSFTFNLATVDPLLSQVGGGGGGGAPHLWVCAGRCRRGQATKSGVPRPRLRVVRRTLTAWTST